MVCARTIVPRGRALRRRPLFDAIICDPPYGIRAGAWQTAARRPAGEATRPVADDVEGGAGADAGDGDDDGGDGGGSSHTPRCRRWGADPYTGNEVMRDLLHLAAQSLVTGGRLVYLLPCHTPLIRHHLAVHPVLTLSSASEQVLNSRSGLYSRVVVVMTKVRTLWTCPGRVVFHGF